MRYRAACPHGNDLGSLDSYVQAENLQVSAAGEEVDDVDIDIAL